MMPSTLRLASVVGLIASLVPVVQAGFNPDSDDNLSVYWGQNSANKLGSQGQQRLSFYCKNAPSINIIPLAFLDGIENPSLNLANAGDNCTAIANTGLLSCPQVEADIQECQSKYDKTIMLSLGGGTYSEGGFSSSSSAVSAAKDLWAMFGPVQSGSSAPRPFGTAVVDGFDFDFESTVQNMEPFVAELRSLIDAAKGTYYLSAAPQCPYPDLSDEGFINGQVAMDWVQVQFYNNYCGVGQYPNNWNFATWDTWAKSVSANPSAKVLVGIPGNVGGANAGSFTSGSQLAGAIANAKSYSSFGGVMIWDMSQLWNNAGFLSQVVSDLGASGSAPTPVPARAPSPTTKAASPTTLVTVTRAASPTTLVTVTKAASSSGTVPQWGQCGGVGYTGSTQCQAPYTCVSEGVWWAACH